MCRSAVITLQIVLNHDFPVCVHALGYAADHLEALEIRNRCLETLYGCVYGLAVCRSCRSVTDENKAGHFQVFNRTQSAMSIRECLNIDALCVLEGPIRRVLPGV